MKLQNDINSWGLFNLLFSFLPSPTLPLMFICRSFLIFTPDMLGSPSGLLSPTPANLFSMPAGLNQLVSPTGLGNSQSNVQHMGASHVSRSTDYDIYKYTYIYIFINLFTDTIRSSRTSIIIIIIHLRQLTVQY